MLKNYLCRSGYKLEREGKEAGQRVGYPFAKRNLPPLPAYIHMTSNIKRW